MTFGAPEWFWGLVLIPVLIAAFTRGERRGAERLREFVSAKLLPQLAATVNRRRRVLRFGLQLLGVGLAVMTLAQPRWGYTFQDVQRKGIDLLIAMDTSRSMLSNDVQPDRLERVKLAAHDLVAELQGDRVGLIAFAGRAFLQAPLTIDYAAALESVNDLDTNTIPEGGTNISDAIKLAVQTFGKSAIGNRALVIFTDGEELSGDALRTAKEAADAGLRIFTIGVGTPQGSLIPVGSEDGGTAFVKDPEGQVVKSKLDEKRLTEIAAAAGGIYLHLDNGPRTMKQLYADGLAKMHAAEIDARLSRRPIERYEWPLSAALIVLALSMLIGERERKRVRNFISARARTATASAAVILLGCQLVCGAAPGLDAYRKGQFNDALSTFEETLKAHPQSPAEDKLQFDSGAAAYKMKQYAKALESFSQALLSRDADLQAKSHYNLGNTLYQQGEEQKSDQKKLNDWRNALEHYQQSLKIDPNDQAAKENYAYVKKKIDDLNKHQQPPPTPTPSPSPQENKQNKQNQQSQQQQGGQGQQNQEQQQSNQQQQSQGQQNQKDQKKNQESPSTNEQQKSSKPQQNASPSSSPGQTKQNQTQQQSSSEASPTPSAGSTSPSEQGESQSTPSPAPSGSPQKKMAGELKEAGEQQNKSEPEQPGEAVQPEPEKEGEMSERQALALLRSMKDEEARVQLDEHKAARHVYKDW